MPCRLLLGEQSGPTGAGPARARLVAVLKRLRSQSLPGNPASAIYGSIITASVLAAQGSHPDSVPRLVLLLLGTSLAFWLAHAYTDVLAYRITAGAEAQGSPLGGESGNRLGTSNVPRSGGHRDYLHALREEWPIVEASLLPVLILLVTYGFGVKVNTAITVALAVDVLELLGWAALAARRMRTGLLEMVLFTAGNGLLGLAIVGLKVVLH